MNMIPSAIRTHQCLPVVVLGWLGARHWTSGGSGEKKSLQWLVLGQNRSGAGKSACVGVVLRGDGGHRESTGCSEQTALSPVPLAASLSPQPPRPSDPPILGRSCHRKSVSSTPRHHLRSVRVITAPPRQYRWRQTDPNPAADSSEYSLCVIKKNKHWVPSSRLGQHLEQRYPFGHPSVQPMQETPPPPMGASSWW